ncbi:unnamed protein product [Allacma fusca]|uniref:Secreted protein n=1 Tax=Allacma fusca TaxID=39272 RepID=A0A8J2LQD9_9HEXA|nr:unnamed protein product [Allacma fusca]
MGIPNFKMNYKGRITTGALVLAMVATLALANGGSQCPGTVCAAGPPGRRCDAKYERTDKCCPVWYCQDGRGGITTHYGMSHSSGGSVVQSISSHRGQGGPGDVDVFVGLRSMFAGMFGRR